jgi:hypothetical protein
MILLQVRPDLLSFASGPASSPELAEMQEALEIERAALERERASLGLPALSPLAAGEAPAAIATRMAADAKALVERAAALERIAAEKDAELAASAKELVAAEKDLLAMARKLSALQQEVDSGMLGGEAETLRQGAQLNAARTQALEKSLAEANARLDGFANAPSAAEYADLQRLYQDALRARDFFEKRAADLEKQLSPTAGPADPAGGPENLPE